MKFQWLKTDNVFSINSITLGLADLGLVLVTGHSYDDGGSNGSGKSSLVSKSLVWGLFGTSPDGVRADDVVNRHSGRGHAFVEICFTSDDSQHYIIKRSREPNRLWLKTGAGQDLTCRLEIDTQKLINKLLGRDFKTFAQTDFFGQGRLLSFPSLSSAEQYKVLETILPLEKLQTWHQTAIASLKPVVHEKEVCRIDVLNCEAVITAHEQTIRNIEDNVKQWERKQSEDIKQVEFLLEGALKRKVANDKDRANIDELIDNLEEPRPLQPMKDRIKEIDKATTKWDKSMVEILTSLGHHLARRRTFETQIHQLDSDKCPTCEQIWPDLNARLDKKTSLTLRLDEYKEKVKKTTQAQQNITDILNGLAQERNQIAQDTQEEVAKEQKLQLLMTSRITLNKTVAEADVIVQTEKLEEYKRFVNPYLKSIEQVKESIEQESSKEVKLKKRQATLEKEIDAMLVWKEAFSKDIRTLLFDKICSFLNTGTEQHLRKLNNTQLHVEFSTNKSMKSGKTKEAFALRCWNDFGGNSFASLSGGEKQMISFAIGLSLADLAETQVRHSSNVLILDEPFLYLDDKNCESVVNYLVDELMKRKSTVFLISNEDHLKALIPNRIHVTKRNRITSATGKGVMTKDE